MYCNKLTSPPSRCNIGSLNLPVIAFHSPMLFSLYPLITKNYFLLTFVICLGTLQWAAARNHKPALSFLGGWGLGRRGAIVGALLVLGGFIWFFTATPGLSSEGLAGGELSTLFIAGGLTALAVTRIASLLWKRLGKLTIADSRFSTETMSRQSQRRTNW